uniref:Uncharacterized protein n=1 Tax=Bracon brevicornis TaxID=1563983 RepID=A0A6V7M6J9_9HYME
MTGVQASSAEIRTKLAQLEESYSQINNSTNVILKTIASTKTISPTARSQPDDSTQATSLQLPN